MYSEGVTLSSTSSPFFITYNMSYLSSFSRLLIAQALQIYHCFAIIKKLTPIPNHWVLQFSNEDLSHFPRLYLSHVWEKFPVKVWKAIPVVFYLISSLSNTTSLLHHLFTKLSISGSLSLSLNGFHSNPFIVFAP